VRALLVSRGFCRDRAWPNLPEADSES
jgi:hypothetical protein